MSLLSCSSSHAGKSDYIAKIYHRQKDGNGAGTLLSDSSYNVAKTNLDMFGAKIRLGSKIAATSTQYKETHGLLQCAPLKGYSNQIPIYLPLGSAKKTSVVFNKSKVISDILQSYGTSQKSDDISLAYAFGRCIIDFVAGQMYRKLHRIRNIDIDKNFNYTGGGNPPEITLPYDIGKTNTGNRYNSIKDALANYRCYGTNYDMYVYKADQNKMDSLASKWLGKNVSVTSFKEIVYLQSDKEYWIDLLNHMFPNRKDKSGYTFQVKGVDYTLLIETLIFQDNNLKDYKSITLEDGTIFCLNKNLYIQDFVKNKYKNYITDFINEIKRCERELTKENYLNWRPIEVGTVYPNIEDLYIVNNSGGVVFKNNNIINERIKINIFSSKEELDTLKQVYENSDQKYEKYTKTYTRYSAVVDNSSPPKRSNLTCLFPNIYPPFITENDYKDYFTSDRKNYLPIEKFEYDNNRTIPSNDGYFMQKHIFDDASLPISNQYQKIHFFNWSPDINPTMKLSPTFPENISENFWMNMDSDHYTPDYSMNESLVYKYIKYPILHNYLGWKCKPSNSYNIGYYLVKNYTSESSLSMDINYTVLFKVKEITRQVILNYTNIKPIDVESKFENWKEGDEYPDFGETNPFQYTSGHSFIQFSPFNYVYRSGVPEMRNIGYYNLHIHPRGRYIPRDDYFVSKQFLNKYKGSYRGYDTFYWSIIDWCKVEDYLYNDRQTITFRFNKKAEQWLEKYKEGVVGLELEILNNGKEEKYIKKDYTLEQWKKATSTWKIETRRCLPTLFVFYSDHYCCNHTISVLFLWFILVPAPWGFMILIIPYTRKAFQVTHVPIQAGDTGYNCFDRFQNLYLKQQGIRPDLADRFENPGYARERQNKYQERLRPNKRYPPHFLDRSFGTDRKKYDPIYGDYVTKGPGYIERPFIRMQGIQGNSRIEGSPTANESHLYSLSTQVYNNFTAFYANEYPQNLQRWYLGQKMSFTPYLNSDIRATLSMAKAGFVYLSKICEANGVSAGSGAWRTFMVHIPHRLPLYCWQKQLMCSYRTMRDSEIQSMGRSYDCNLSGSTLTFRSKSKGEAVSLNMEVYCPGYKSRYGADLTNTQYMMVERKNNIDTLYDQYINPKPTSIPKDLSNSMLKNNTELRVQVYGPTYWQQLRDEGDIYPAEVKNFTKPKPTKSFREAMKEYLNKLSNEQLVKAYNRKFNTTFGSDLSTEEHPLEVKDEYSAHRVDSDAPDRKDRVYLPTMYYSYSSKAFPMPIFYNNSASN